MKNKFKIGQKVSFKRKVFGIERIITNTIHNIEELDGEVFYHIGGVGQALFERDLEGKEDCFIVNENKIINN
tara:strand:+ start:286 stop:501 length:216 start_codon:yes stop_codon:yes gene_type:complete